MLQDFITFVREQGVIGLAVGFILGGSVSSLVTSLVNNIINPIIGMIIPNATSLETAVIPILGGGELMIGGFLVTLINFFIIAFVVYFGFKGLGLANLAKKKG